MISPKMAWRGKFRFRRAGWQWALVALLAGHAWAQAPQIGAGGVVNGASFTPTVSPGAILSIFGTNLATTTASAPTLPLPTIFGGTQVLINGVAAPLFFVSPLQVNAQVPWEASGTNLSVQVNVNGVLSSAVTVASAAAAPGLFGLPSGQGAILISGTGGSLAAPLGAFPGSRPVRPGETLEIFATGAGAVSNRPATGAGGPTNPLATSLITPTVIIGGIPATVSFAGLAPTYVGLYQINVVVPTTVPGGNAVGVTLTVGNVTSNTMTIAVDSPIAPLLPDLTLTKTASSPSVLSAATLTYTLTARNVGAGVAQSVTVRDPLPAGMTFQSCTVSPSGTCSSSAGTVTASVGTMAAGATAVITLAAVAPTVSSDTPITNTATISTTTAESNTTNNSASQTSTVSSARLPDLTISMTASPSSVNSGSTLSYTLTIRNIGEGVAPNATVTATLPAETPFSSCSVPADTTCAGSGTTVTATLGPLGVGSIVTIVINTLAGSVANTIFVTSGASVSTTSPEVTRDNNSTTVEVAVVPAGQPTGGGGGAGGGAGGGGGGVVTAPCGTPVIGVDPCITIAVNGLAVTSGGTALVNTGSTVTLVVTVSNIGSLVTPSVVTVIGTIPAELTPVPGQTAITCTIQPVDPARVCTVAGAGVTANFGLIAAGSAVSLTLTAAAPVSVPGGGVTATLAVSFSTGAVANEISLTNNQVSITLTVGVNITTTPPTGGGGGGGGGGVVIPPAGVSGPSGGPIGGQVQALAVNPALPTNLFAGTNGGGVFRSTDGGGSWAATNSGLSTFLNVQAVAIDPTTNPVTVYVGTNTGGVFKSTDGGSTWLPFNVGLPANANIKALALDFSQGTTVGSPAPPVYVGTNGLPAGGVFKSVSGGNWVPFSTGLTNVNILTLLTDQLGNVYAGTTGTGTGGVFKSPTLATNGNWAAFNSGGVTGATAVNALVIESGGANIYAGTNGGGVFKSPTNAVNWSAFNTNLGNLTVNALAIDTFVSNGIAAPNVYAGTTGGVFKSSITTANWAAQSFGLLNRTIQALAVDPTVPTTTATSATTIYAATSGMGVAKSLNGGQSWAVSIAGMTAGAIRAVLVDPTTTPVTLYVGSNGGGVFKNTDGTATTWSLINSGLTDTNIRAMAIDVATVPASVYVGTPSGVFKTANGGTNWFLAGAAGTGLAETNVQALAIDRSTSPATIYAGTDGTGGVGVFRSTDSGATWSAFFSAGLTTTNILSLALDGAGNIYAGSSGGGVFKSVVTAAGWAAANTNITAAAADRTVNAIVIDPSNILLVYAATNNGVYKSTDGAATWTHPLASLQARALVIDRAAPNNLYVSTDNSITPLLKSVDNGANWTSFSSGLGLIPVQTIAINVPPNTLNLFLGTSGGGLFVTTTGGSTWTPAGTGLTIPGLINQAGGGPTGGDIRAFAVSSGIVYAATNGGGIYQGSGGSNWTAFNTDLTNTVVQAVAADPTNGIVYAGTSTGVFKKAGTDAGWVPANLGLGANTDVRSLAVETVNCLVGACAVYAGTTGGVFKSTNGGASWTPFNTGLQVTIQALVVDVSGNLYAGTATGVFRSPTSIIGWGTAAGPGDTRSLALDMTVAPAPVYAGTAVGTVFKSTSSGASWSAFSTGLPGGLVIAALAVDGVAAPNTVVYAGSNAGAGGVFKSLTSTVGGGWAAFTSSSSGLTNPVIQALTVIGSASVLAGTQGGGVFLSPTSGTSTTAAWTASNAGLSAATISALVTDPTTSTTLYAGTLGAGVFKSLDGGGTWQSFNPANFATLTNRIIQTLAFDTASNLYAGTLGGGVFVTPTIVGGAVTSVPVWAAFNSGPLPNLDVRALVLDTSKIYAGTAAGVFVSDPTGVAASGSWATFNGGTLTNTNILSLARDTTNLYAGTSGGGVFKSLLFAGGAGGGWAAFNSAGITGTIVSTLAVDVTNSLIYAGNTVGGVFKSATGAAAWTAINFGGLAGADIRALAIDPTTPSTVYAGTNTRGVFRTINATAGTPVTWVPINSGITLANLSIRSFTVSPTTPANVAAGSNGGGVFRTTTATTNPPTWLASSP